MNPIFETRSPRNGGNRARANRDNRNAERLDTTETLKAHQVRRLCVAFGCAEATGYTLAVLAFGEAKR
jgi:adenylate kinase